MEGTIGEIRIFGGNFAPGNWNYCNGALQSIAENSALFSVIGNIYGGDGQTTFALPDFRGRIPVGTGDGCGLDPYYLGETGGAETKTMTTQEMPMHTHLTSIRFALPAYSEAGGSDPSAAILASVSNAYTDGQTDSHLAPFNAQVTLQSTGSGAPFSVMQPYLTLNYVICMEGIYPSRA